MNPILGNFLVSSEVFSIFEFLIPRPFLRGCSILFWWTNYARRFKKVRDIRSWNVARN